MCFDAMHAIKGPYAQHVFSDLLGIDKAQLAAAARDIIKLTHFTGVEKPTLSS